MSPERTGRAMHVRIVKVESESREKRKSMHVRSVRVEAIDRDIISLFH